MQIFTHLLLLTPEHTGNCKVTVMNKVYIAFASAVSLIVSVNSYANESAYVVDYQYDVVASSVDPVRRETQHALQSLDYQLALDIRKRAIDALSTMDGDVAMVSHNATSETAQASLAPVITLNSKSDSDSKKDALIPCSK